MPCGHRAQQKGYHRAQPWRRSPDDIAPAPGRLSMTCARLCPALRYEAAEETGAAACGKQQIRRGRQPSADGMMPAHQTLASQE
jgi:hypothetical protein